MTLRSRKFTPKVLIGAPRRSAGAPSPDGSLILYTQTSYSFESHSQTSGVYTLDVKTGLSTVVTTDPRAREPNWLGLGSDVVWLREADNGHTSFVVADVKDAGRSYTAGSVSAPASNLKIHPLNAKKAAIAFSCRSNPDGSIYNPKDVPPSHSSAMVYDSLFVRHWDTYVGPQRNTIWTAVLHKLPANVTARDGRWKLLAVANRLRAMPDWECPIPPFGGTDHFALADAYLIIVTKYPNINPATHTACVLWLLYVPDWLSEVQETVESIVIQSPDQAIWGAATSPVFSPDGTSAAWLAMPEDGYESDQNQISLVRFRGATVSSSSVLDMRSGPIKWDRSPSSLIFSADGTKLFALAEDMGRVALFELDLSGLHLSGSSRVEPRRLTSQASISDLTRASYLSSKLFLSTSSLVDSSSYHLLDPAEADPSPRCISSLTQHGAIFGLSANQVSSVWWPGAGHSDGRQIHAWMVKPSFFQAGHKYPLAYFIHGGPQGAWTDSWSTRWNPAVFAEQGYIVLCPNPTGSTGYGQGFTDAIRNQWGGLPYLELANGISHIETTAALRDMIDTDRMVALGASYGGYMINWLQGQPLGRRFRALVCHDGIFSMTSQLASDEQYFPTHDLGGPIWQSQHNWDRWDPSRHTANWATPQLVIHGQRDYRLPISEGLAAFNVLQMRGIQSRFLTFPDENHWVLGHENSLVWHTVVLDWIARFCRPEDENEHEEKQEDEAGEEGGAAKLVRMARRGRRKDGSGDGDAGLDRIESPDKGENGRSCGLDRKTQDAVRSQTPSRAYLFDSSKVI